MLPCHGLFIVNFSLFCVKCIIIIRLAISGGTKLAGVDHFTRGCRLPGTRISGQKCRSRTHHCGAAKIASIKFRVKDGWHRSHANAV